MMEPRKKPQNVPDLPRYPTIYTEREYDLAMAKCERMAANDPAPGTAEGDGLIELTRTIREYEEKRGWR